MIKNQIYNDFHGSIIIDEPVELDVNPDCKNWYHETLNSRAKLPHLKPVVIISCIHEESK
jgi:hypothetical protein